MLKHWEFWFAVIGAIISSTIMFTDLKEGQALQQKDIGYIREDIAEIKERLDDTDTHKIPNRLAADVWKALP